MKTIAVWVLGIGVVVLWCALECCLTVVPLMVGFWILKALGFFG